MNKRTFMNYLEEYQNNKFWNRYISELANKPVKVGTERWYVMHVETYVKSVPKLKLLEHSRENLNRYFTGLARQPGIKDWIFTQHVEALQILFCKVIKVNWCDQIDWDFWYLSAKQLEDAHPSIARQSILSPADKQRNVSGNITISINFVMKSHVQIFERLITEI